MRDQWRRAKSISFSSGVHNWLGRLADAQRGQIGRYANRLALALTLTGHCVILLDLYCIGIWYYHITIWLYYIPVKARCWTVAVSGTWSYVACHHIIPAQRAPAPAYFVSVVRGKLKRSTPTVVPYTDIKAIQQAKPNQRTNRALNQGVKTGVGCYWNKGLGWSCVYQDRRSKQRRIREWVMAYSWETSAGLWCFSGTVLYGTVHTAVAFTVRYCTPPTHDVQAGGYFPHRRVPGLAPITITETIGIHLYRYTVSAMPCRSSQSLLASPVQYVADMAWAHARSLLRRYWSTSTGFVFSATPKSVRPGFSDCVG